MGGNLLWPKAIEWFNDPRVLNQQIVISFSQKTPDAVKNDTPESIKIDQGKFMIYDSIINNKIENLAPFNPNYNIANLYFAYIPKLD